MTNFGVILSEAKDLLVSVVILSEAKDLLFSESRCGISATIAAKVESAVR